MKRHAGFTLVELIIVMVILGILATFAIPRFYSFRTQANIAVVNGIYGAVQGAMVTAHGAALAANTTGGNITMEGNSVALTFGYPSPAGITSAVRLGGPVSVTTAVTSATFTVTTANTPASCIVAYTQAFSNSAARVSSTTTGC